MHVLYACMHCNLCIDKHNFLRKTSALIRCFCKLQKVFHHSSSALVGEIFELSPINRKGGSNWQIDLAATPRLLTPGAPAPLSKSARAPHGVAGHIHGGMAGRQADICTRCISHMSTKPSRGCSSRSTPSRRRCCGRLEGGDGGSGRCGSATTLSPGPSARANGGKQRRKLRGRKPRRDRIRSLTRASMLGCARIMWIESC